VQPAIARRAIRAEAEIGSIVLCNLEISAADPPATIGAINDVELKWVARELRSMVQQVIEDVASRPAPRLAPGDRKQAVRELAEVLP
jgi:hypothetical protein